jgi:hypothetical protein
LSGQLPSSLHRIHAQRPKDGAPSGGDPWTELPVGEAVARGRIRVSMLDASVLPPLDLLVPARAR